jgi:hypothetical protein
VAPSPQRYRSTQKSRAARGRIAAGGLLSFAISRFLPEVPYDA